MEGIGILSNLINSVTCKSTIIIFLIVQVCISVLVIRVYGIVLKSFTESSFSVNNKVSQYIFSV